MSAGLLAGRVALVTGGARGIGRAASLALAAQGATVVLTSRDADSAVAAASEIAATTGSSTIGLGADLSEPEATSRLAREVFTRTKRLNVLVNNAGVMVEGMLGMVDAAAIDAQFALNARAPLLLTQACSRLMQRSGGGSVINIGSIVGEIGLAGYAVYSMSKAAVTGLTRSAAQELGPLGIRVNAVVPGMIDTELVAHLDAETRDSRVRDTALGRIGRPEDVAAVIVFLASDAAAFVTGQVIGVDGGLRM